MQPDGPTIRGIVETALYVADLDRAERFYRRVLGSDVLVSDERLRALSAGADQVLLLFLRGASNESMHLPGGTIPAHDGDGHLHVALAIDRDDLTAWRSHLADCGVAVESTMEWPRGGTSLYFRDPDGHLVELVTPGCWSIY